MGKVKNEKKVNGNYAELWNHLELYGNKMASTLKKLECEKCQKKFSGNKVVRGYSGIQAKMGVLMPPFPT